VNKHVELTDFYFGKQNVYTTQGMQFHESMFRFSPKDQKEDASNLRLLL
jgi:hypothetical protein